MRKATCFLMLALGVLSLNAHADVETAKAFAKKYAAIAKNINPDFKGFLPDMGRNFYTRQFTLKGKQVSCSSCHTDNPANPGKHIVTGKPIKPLSPVVEKSRFTDLEKVEKNFTDHCNEILGRDCTAMEKGNYIAYLLTVKFDAQGNEQK
jgi:mono/diheme cytochrome c family protein